MFDQVVAAHITLEEVASGFDASALTPEAASRWMLELAFISRLVDGMVGPCAKRMAETSLSSADAVASVAKTLGVRVGEVRGAIATAKRREELPATDRAVRGGRLSAQEAQLIAAAASKNPAAEQDLLDIAEQGLVPLKDACVRARAAVEDPGERAKRHHRQREWRSWTDADGMVVGRFRFAPEVGGPLQKKIEAQAQRIFKEHKAGTEHESHDAYAADAVAGFLLADTTAAAESTETVKASGPSYVVNIMLDHGVMMRGGTADGEICEIPGVGPVDVSWVKDLLGSAFLTVVIKKGKDILTVARLGRHVPAAVMTALLVDGRECDVESCNHRGYLERDHIDDHARGGPTSFKNLGWLCYRHHRLKTAGWILGPADPVTRKRTLRAPPDVRAPDSYDERRKMIHEPDKVSS
jgi:Domain of unknown function (DUF222)